MGDTGFLSGPRCGSAYFRRCVEAVKDAVENNTPYTWEQVLGRRRAEELIRAREYPFVALVEITGMSGVSIAEALGVKVSQVNYHRRKHVGYQRVYPGEREAYATFLANVKKRLHELEMQ